MPDLRSALTDPDAASLAAAARERRFATFLKRFPQLAEMSVLDLGGEAHTWLSVGAHPRHVTLLNLPRPSSIAAQRIQAAGAGGWMASEPGDACNPPPAILEQHFDLVFSNSVIEHVGGHFRRVRFAHWVHQLGAHHWIQTPNRHFPIEPHFLIPGLQFAPPRLQAAALSHWPYTRRRFRALAWPQRMNAAMGIELLSPSVFHSYFPESELLRERFYGWTKSLIAIR